jgi:hypothetical protein
MNIVPYLFKAGTLEPEKQLFLGKGCVISNNRVTVETDVTVQSAPRLYNEDQLPLQERSMD